MKTHVMTLEEKELWQKAYVAAFVAEFNRNFRLRHDFDEAMKNTSAEWAAYVANGAIIKLNEWRDTEDDLVGQVIDYSEEWCE